MRGRSAFEINKVLLDSKGKKSYKYISLQLKRDVPLVKSFRLEFGIYRSQNIFWLT